MTALLPSDDEVQAALLANRAVRLAASSKVKPDLNYPFSDSEREAMRAALIAASITRATSSCDGDNPQIGYNSGEPRYVYCIACKAQTGYVDGGIEAATAAWNTRPGLHGPFGWINGHKMMSEDSWTLEDGPVENDAEYFSIPLFARVDPFSEAGKDCALSARPAAEAEPVAWATVRVEDTCDGLLIHPDDAKKWNLIPDHQYEGSFLPDGRYRIKLTPPRPDREAAKAGWNACRRSIYAVCEDVDREADQAAKFDGEHAKGYAAGMARAAKSIARGFNAMEAEDDDNFVKATDALLTASEPGALEKLPCDVHLPPRTYLRKGVAISTLMVALRQRVGRPDEDVRLTHEPGAGGLTTDKAIDLLTDGEGDTVTFCAPNPDFNGLPNECVLVNASWTGWQDRGFRADTRAACLSAAIQAMREVALPAAPTDGGVS